MSKAGRAPESGSREGRFRCTGPATPGSAGPASAPMATATASALAELLSINGLEAPAGTTTHRQLTTGDVDRFRSIAERMFGEAFPDVEGVEAGAAA